MIAVGPLILFAFVLFHSPVFGQQDGNLKAVIVLFRHGDRSPLSSWPNDEYFNDSSLWPDGYGQLNNLGKQRHYRLGQWFRNRYDGFLPARYNSSDIYVRSTDVDRTLMSAASNLAGLYPPSGDQIWNDEIPWQAIPIHTVPRAYDPILSDKVPCPKRDRLYKEFLNSTEFQQFNREHADLFQNISEVTGFSLTEVNLRTISRIFSTLTIYRGFNWTLPEWANHYWPKLKPLAAKHFQFYTHTPDLARLKAGPFINYLTDQVKAATSTEVRKFLMLSGHDTTIANRINVMGLYPDAVPEFASSVIWEVKSRNKSDEHFYVNMYFKNNTHFSPLTLPGCDFNCDITDFIALLKPISMNDDKWVRECNDQL